jgi:hypothetical protein
MVTLGSIPLSLGREPGNARGLGIKVSGGPPGADRVKAKHARASPRELQVASMEQLAHLAATHLGFKLHRVRLGGNLIGQDEISAYFHQFITLPADHCELPAPYEVSNGDVVSTVALPAAARARAGPGQSPGLPDHDDSRPNSQTHAGDG